MSKEKFTQEWNDIYFPLISDSVGNHIATIAACENEVMRKRGNLIKSAPEMYKMLAITRKMFEDLADIVPNEQAKDLLYDMASDIKSVLKKARGEE